MATHPAAGPLAAVLLLVMMLGPAPVARAQQVGSYTTGAAVTVSTNSAGSTGNIVDGLDNTQWQSGACAAAGARYDARRSFTARIPEEWCESQPAAPQGPAARAAAAPPQHPQPPVCPSNP